MCFNLTLEHILRHFSPYMENFFTFAFRFSEQERCLSGRKEQFAKLSYAQQRTGGSNPPLSAAIVSIGGFPIPREPPIISEILYFTAPEGINGLKLADRR